MTRHDQQTAPASSAPHHQVRAVLAEIGTEETVARLEARIEELEQQLSRAERRADEAEQSREGELRMMRARVDDTLAVVEEVIEEQRAGRGQFEQRFTAMLRESEDTSRSQLGELREDLMPRVQRALAVAEELRTQVDHERTLVAEGADDADPERADQLATRYAELMAELQRLRERVEAEGRERETSVASVEERLAQRLATLKADLARQADEDLARGEQLRRDLDAGVGELRGTLDLRTGKLEDAIEELGDAVGDLERAAEEREEAADAGHVQQLQRMQQLLAERLEAEAEERHADIRRLSARLDEVARLLETEHGRVGADATRRAAELAQVRADSDDLASRLELLQGRLTDAVTQVAGTLTNRVAALHGDVEAIREGMHHQDERLAAAGQLRRRIEELASRAEGGADSQRVEELANEVAELRHQMSRLVASFAGRGEQLDDLTSRVGQLDTIGRSQEQLRGEVRELTGRAAELGTRVDQTEQIARAAAQAIASAVRRSRASQRAATEVQNATDGADEDRTTNGDAPAGW